jgi:hypothetical protein
MREIGFGGRAPRSISEFSKCTRDAWKALKVLKIESRILPDILSVNHSASHAGMPV